MIPLPLWTEKQLSILGIFGLVLGAKSARNTALESQYLFLRIVKSFGGLTGFRKPTPYYVN